MKDTDKVELTVGNIKAAAEKCGTAKEVLKELFPDVFKPSPPEWEDVTDEARVMFHAGSGKFNLMFRNGLDWPFIVVITGDPDSGSYGQGHYKIDDNKIWRKKSK